MIGFFVISTQLGGAEQSLLDYFRHTERDRGGLLVILPKNEGPLIEELKKLNIKTKTLPMPEFLFSQSRQNSFLFSLSFPLLSLFAFWHIIKVSKLIKSKKLQLIHTTGIKYHLFVSLAVILFGGPKVVLHIRDLINGWFLRKLFNQLGSHSKITLVANSKISAQTLNPSVPVIYNGFDDSKFHPSPSSKLKEQIGIDSNMTLVTLVGVIARWKGQREFLNAAQRVLETQSNVHFLIVGDQIYDTKGDQGELTQLKALASHPSLKKHIHFLPFQQNISSIYQGTDILVHNSIHPEPFGRVIVEGLLCGCQVSAANEGGPLEIFNSPTEGLHHNPRDPEDLAKNLRILLQSPEKSQQMAKRGHRRALQFTMNEYVHNLDRLLNSSHSEPRY
ncbi:MAG: glycosyltransferase [Pseudomonadota bacterium]